MRLTLDHVLLAGGIALGLGSAVYGGYAAWALRHPPPSIAAQVEPGCDLHRGPCRATLPGGGSVSIAIAPRPIPLAQPIRFEVEVSGVEARSVETDIRSFDMYMGPNHRTLGEVARGRYTGETVLPVCTRESMRWRLTLAVKSGSDTYQVPFDFVTPRPTDRRSS